MRQYGIHFSPVPHSSAHRKKKFIVATPAPGDFALELLVKLNKFTTSQ
jgi:hypothetical protein